jgi:hypothetical protein
MVRIHLPPAGSPLRTWRQRNRLLAAAEDWGLDRGFNGEPGERSQAGGDRVRRCLRCGRCRRKCEASPRRNALGSEFLAAPGTDDQIRFPRDNLLIFRRRRVKQDRCREQAESEPARQRQPATRSRSREDATHCCPVNTRIDSIG